jgi:uncharacterized protein
MFIETKEFPGSSLDVDVAFARPPMDGTVGEGEAVHLTARVTRVRGGVRVVGHLGTEVSLPCARCNGTFRLPVETDFNLMYGPQGREHQDVGGEIILSAEDCALASLDQAGRIELLELTQEQVYLALPLKPVCRDDCRGLCGHCGIDRNIESCACGGPDPDPRLAVLAEIKRRL